MALKDDHWLEGFTTEVHHGLPNKALTYINFIITLKMLRTYFELHALMAPAIQYRFYYRVILSKLNMVNMRESRVIKLLFNKNCGTRST